MNLLAHINRMDRQRTGHYCPACKGWHAADDMDLGRFWQHSDAMRAHFGAVCCNACTDEHVVTADGVLMRAEDAVRGIDYLWSSDEAFQGALEAGRGAA